jgi:hypothetical protein
VPSIALSDVSSENPNGLSTPKPDITLGLAHTCFTPLQRTVLMLLQDDCRVLSEPHQAQIGLRFPFLVVESKGGAAGGNMIWAGRRVVGIGASPNPSDLRRSSIAASAQQTPSRAGTSMEEFLDHVEDFLAGRTEEGFD